jgi:hypothetical protein
VDPPDSLIPILSFYYGGGSNVNSDTIYLSNIGNTKVTGLIGSVTVTGNSSSALQHVSVSVPGTLNAAQVQYVTGNYLWQHAIDP